MSNREFFVERWEAEIPAMVRVLRAVPADKLDYRPHPVSRSAGELVTLLVYEAGAGVELADNPDLHWSEPAKCAPPEEMAAKFEQNARAMIERVRRLDENYWGRKARLLVGGQSVHEGTVQSFYWETLLDAVHHRGQLSVYLRPMGSKVPSIYGPSADDMGESG